MNARGRGHYVSGSILESVADFLIENHRFDYGPSLPYLLGLLIKSVSSSQKIHPYKVRRAITTLEKSNLINLQREGDQIYVTLEEKGYKKVAQYSLKKLLDYKLKQKKWDGKWFMVFFDIPETQRVKRNYLRDFLKEIGFYQYQLSVYIFPYECESEINFIKQVVEGAKYTKYIIADKIEDEETIKRHFKL